MRACRVFSKRVNFIQGAGKESHFKSSNRGDSESDILEQTPDTDDSGPHSCPGEWTKHSNTNSNNRNVNQYKAKKVHKVTNPTVKESSTSGSTSQKVSTREVALSLYRVLVSGTSPANHERSNSSYVHVWWFAWLKI